MGGSSLWSSVKFLISSALSFVYFKCLYSSSISLGLMIVKKNGPQMEWHYWGGEFARVGLTLLEEVGHCGDGFEVSYMVTLHSV